MRELPANTVTITDGFWEPRLRLNAQKAIFHQWEQLEKTGCIENFRLVADGMEGIREGFFFADSDAFKWLDAAARIYASWPSEELKSLVDGFVDLVSRTQTEDGYLYTYNQLFFPGMRWTNLQIEHELYCHGHLIEATVSHFQATGERALLDIGVKTANLLVREFMDAGPTGTPGHEEIELALIRLYQVTQNQAYLELAQHFIEQRGRITPFIPYILQSNKDFAARSQIVIQKQASYYAAHPEHAEKFQLPGDNVSRKPAWGKQRWFVNMATGKYFQQHRPVRKQTVPVGHAVRFAYLETAIATLLREQDDLSLRHTLEAAWDRMMARRMYITGGVGSLPNIEGFGRDYELDPEYSYSETCAALGVIFWNWEMSLLSGDARYADLTEWQLYNAAAVGLGQDGTSYLYNNPLTCQGGVTRQAWFKCPCCPSNISRTWADLGKYIYTFEGNEVWVHQYMGNQVVLEGGFGIRMDSGLPWEGHVSITLEPQNPAEYSLNLRIPSWSKGTNLKVNGRSYPVANPRSPERQRTASGYDPRGSWYIPIRRTWTPGDVVEIAFQMPITLQGSHPRVKATRGQVAITRGPLVYCLESSDNPGVDLFDVTIEPDSLQVKFSPDHFGGIQVIVGQTAASEPLTFIPYYLWANRGESQMSVYVKA
jgi:DUF1680 family protein